MYRTIKKSLLLISLLALASVLAHLYVKSQVYYPVVRLEAPEGLSIAAVLPETSERKACGVANDRFLAPFREQCKDCKIAMARCERELRGFELALRDGTPLPYPTVTASDAHVAFLGPSEIARISCHAAATNMAAKGFKSAVCIPAQQSAGPKS